MMFMSMMMVSGFLLVVGTFLLIIVPLAIGLPLLITGASRRKKCLAAGIKPRKASSIYNRGRYILWNTGSGGNVYSCDVCGRRGKTCNKRYAV